jgi:pimeloyl-ACP methyl ester carboxylesterase
MGATVAQRFAIDYPQRTRALVLEGAFQPRAGNEGIAEFWKTVSTLVDPVDPAMVRDFQQSTLANPVPADFFETVVGESLKMPARVWRAALEPFLTINFAAQLTDIAVPTLLIWGDRDTFALRADQEALRSAISGSRLVTYVGAGHCPHWEEPDRYAAQIVAFVKELETP